MIYLNSNQIEAYEKFRKYKYLYLKAPTGWGKSFFAMKAFQDLKYKAIIICPSHLLKQWKAYLTDENIPHTANSFHEDRKAGNVSVWSVQKITRMFKNDKKFLYQFKSRAIDSLMVIDEYHRILGMTSNIYRSLQTIKAHMYLFLSATPLERGIQDMYTALRINAVLDIKKNWGNTWSSVTNFKAYHCVMGGFENRTITDVFPLAKMKMLNELTVAYHSGIEDRLVKHHKMVTKAPEVKQILKDYRKSEDYNYMTARTMLNGFRYIEDLEDFDNPKKTQWLFDSAKVPALKALIKKQKGKALLFFEFVAEKTLLEGIEGLVFYDKKKMNVDTFKDSPHKVLAVHYRSLGEGVRVKYIDTIYMFTISISNRMRTQAQGRAIYQGRETPIDLYEFTTDTTFETSIVQKLNHKEREVKSLLLKLEEQKDDIPI